MNIIKNKEIIENYIITKKQLNVNKKLIDKITKKENKLKLKMNVLNDKMIKEMKRKTNIDQNDYMYSSLSADGITIEYNFINEELRLKFQDAIMEKQFIIDKVLNKYDDKLKYKKITDKLKAYEINKNLLSLTINKANINNLITTLTELEKNNNIKPLPYKEDNDELFLKNVNTHIKNILSFLDKCYKKKQYDLDNKLNELYIDNIKGYLMFHNIFI